MALIKISCENCGACCELLLFNYGKIGLKNELLLREFADVRGFEVLNFYGNVFVFFRKRCPFLTENQKCSRYNSEIRPRSCANFHPGSLECLACRRIKNINLSTQK